MTGLSVAAITILANTAHPAALRALPCCAAMLVVIMLREIRQPDPLSGRMSRALAVT